MKQFVVLMILSLVTVACQVETKTSSSSEFQPVCADRVATKPDDALGDWNEIDESDIYVSTGQYKMRAYGVGYNGPMGSSFFSGTLKEDSKIIGSKSCLTASSPEALNVESISPFIALPKMIQAANGQFRDELQTLFLDNVANQYSFKLLERNSSLPAHFEAARQSGIEVHIFRYKESGEVVLTMAQLKPSSTIFRVVAYYGYQAPGE